MTLYLFTGDDWLRERAVERLKRELTGKDPSAWAQTQLDGEDFRVTRFVEALQSQSLLSEGVIVHVRRIEMLEEPQALIPYLERAVSTSNKSKAHIIIEGEKLDKRGKFYKIITQLGKAHDYSRPTRRDLPTAAAQLLKEYGLKLSPQAFRYLLEHIDSDLARIGREAEKLLIYAQGKEISLDEIQGLLFHHHEGNLFGALDALMERKPSAIKELEAVLAGGEEASKVFFMMASQIRSLIRIQSLAQEGLSNDDIASRTGDFSWLVAKRRKIAQATPMSRLKELIHRLHQEDLCIKRGERQPEESLWALVLEWLYPAAPAQSESN